MLRRTALVCVVALAVAAVAGCGDDAGEPDEEGRARLVDSLGFLATDLGLTDGEVACTARTIEEDLDGEDLDAVAEQVRRVDAGDVALADLPADVSTTITDSVAACAGRS
ncbi:hypothetical protein HC251_15015 [Iamia sp. SCSIO 61187]|uniref:hypothetical protein n=1 Tax=Iamia sp. SCSIO 61187 TaxID=2722752 RepID=UPI001C628E98|nr:hypothetical protein [Iamia sp. SCSIO 61187]QYG93605.1 hypothetical protein HC251_15015 [Iamia sp. SCSIO 61187]